MPNGAQAEAKNIMQLHHELKEPAMQVEVVPAITHNSLLHVSKCTCANDIAIFTPMEVKLLDVNNTSHKTKRPFSEGGMTQPEGFGGYQSSHMTNTATST